MKASELIIRLQELIDEHGDLEVYSHYDYGVLDPVTEARLSKNPWLVSEIITLE